MKTVKIFLLATAIFGLSGCCMKSIQIKPQMDALDLQTAQAGSLSANIAIDFKECCPSKEQEAIALKMQSSMADLYTQLLNNEISQEDYNYKINAATNAIENVVLICAPKSESKTKAFSLDRSLDEAWKELQRVNQEILLTKSRNQ